MWVYCNCTRVILVFFRAAGMNQAYPYIPIHVQINHNELLQAMPMFSYLEIRLHDQSHIGPWSFVVVGLPCNYPYLSLHGGTLASPQATPTFLRVTLKTWEWPGERLEELCVTLIRDCASECTLWMKQVYTCSCVSCPANTLCWIRWESDALMRLYTAWVVSPNLALRA